MEVSLHIYAILPTFKPIFLIQKLSSRNKSCKLKDLMEAYIARLQMNDLLIAKNHAPSDSDVNRSQS